VHKRKGVGERAADEHIQQTHSKHAKCMSSRTLELLNDARNDCPYLVPCVCVCGQRKRRARAVAVARARAQEEADSDAHFAALAKQARAAKVK